MGRRIVRKSYKASAITILFILSLSLFMGIQAAYADEVLQRIETKDYPIIRLSLSYTAFDEVDKAGRAEQNIAISENGQHVKDISISASKIPLKVKPEPLSIVMLIDSSGSMKGKPIVDAKAAANHFISLLGDEDQVSIISFNSKPNLMVDYTSNKRRLTDSINTIQVYGETAVYDALSLAAGQASKSGIKQKYIVLLSDGGDTVSKAEPQACIDQLKALKVSVYTIALKSPEFDMVALEDISNQSGGKLVEAANSDDFKPFYSRLATQIKNQIEVEYKSPGFRTKDINLRVVIGSGSDVMHISTVYQNPAFVKADNVVRNSAKEAIKVNPIVDNWVLKPVASKPVILLIAFLSSSLFVYGMVSTLTRRRSVLRKQIGMYEDMWNQSSCDDEELSAGKNPYVSKALDIVGHFAEKRGFTELVRGKLEQAGLPLRPVEYIFFHSLIVLVPSVILQLLYGNLFLTLVFILVLTIFPMLAVQIAIDRRQSRFNEMLPDTITMIAGSLRAGYSLLQAISLVADEGKPPVSVEFKRALTEARLGLPVEMALEKMARRIGSEDFYWTVLAINIQREIGGNLAEVLDIVAKTIREREGLKRHIKALTAEGRLSAYILIALPFVISVLLFVINPEYITILFSHVLGWAMVGIAAVLMVIGIFWMKKIISIEV
ncbi:MAG: type II secretion system F family protein [Actinobacteria bacterium]|nr:type II secretion system F family protein [Actinomycetota bacterium]